MNISDFYSELNSMGDDEKLEINKNKEVRKIHFDGKGKRHSTFIGIFENVGDSHQPVKNKLWASAYNPGLKSFSDFGKPLPKRNNTELEATVWLGLFEMFKDTAKKSKFTDTSGLEFDILEAMEIKVYYFRGNPRYVEFNGKKLGIEQHSPELKKEEIHTGIGYCSECGKKMSIISLSDYFDRTNNKEYSFCFICEDMEIRKNRNLVKK